MIGIIVAVYSNYPEKLIESCQDPEIAIRWYIVFHGHDRSLEARLKAFAATTERVVFLPYRLNRGLARSWNDALRFSQVMEDEFAIIINDDLFFRPGGIRSFVEYVRAQPLDYGLATVMGLEIGDSPSAGQTIPQELACGVVGKAAIETIGCFDQNFTPAYFEDIDYIHRLRTAGLPIVIDERILVEHDRSKTLRTNEEIKASVSATFGRNENYFIRKWGGKYGHTTFATPFDDPALSLHIPYERADNPYPGVLESRRVIGTIPNASGKLDELGRQHGTDKASSHHDFLSFYEQLLASRREDICSILEIGVGEGASLRVWREFFPEARITAIDIEANAIRHGSDRIDIEIVDQGNPRHLLNVAMRRGPFDLIIDDGSHVWGHQILALQMLFPFVKPFGHFIIENIDTSYGNYVTSFSRGRSSSTADYLKHLLDRLVADAALQDVPEPDPYIASYAAAIAHLSFIRRGCVIARNGMP